MAGLLVPVVPLYSASACAFSFDVFHAAGVQRRAQRAACRLNPRQTEISAARSPSLARGTRWGSYRTWTIASNWCLHPRHSYS